MLDEDRPAGEQPSVALADLDRKLDAVMGAVAALGESHDQLRSHVAEAESRRSQDSRRLEERIEAMEQHLLYPEPEADGVSGAGPLDLGPLEGDVARIFDVLGLLADGLEQLERRAEEQVGILREAIEGPLEARLSTLTSAIERLATSGGSDGDTRVLERVEELADALRAATWQAPDVADELAAAVRNQVQGLDMAGSVASATRALETRLTQHTESALAGVLHIIDGRLATLRGAFSQTGGDQSGGGGGFEAGAVMGATQAAWNRLDQRLDAEFDDLGRQLQAMAAMVEHAVEASEAAANRPVVTAEQLRRAASAVKESVVTAGKSRRDRRGGPRSLGPG